MCCYERIKRHPRASRYACQCGALPPISSLLGKLRQKHRATDPALDGLQFGMGQRWAPTLANEIMPSLLVGGTLQYWGRCDTEPVRRELSPTTSVKFLNQPNPLRACCWMEGGRWRCSRSVAGVGR